MSRENGFAERVVVLQGSSRAAEVSAAVDVIVSDVPGALPLFGAHLSNLLDARQRYLVPQGQMIPQTDAFSAAVVSSPGSFDDRHRPWQTAVPGLKLRSVLPAIDNRCYEYRAHPCELLCSPAEWARIEYSTFTQLGLRGSVRLPISHPGTGHGLVVWYDRTLAAGISYSNAPGAREGDYSQMLLPWPEPARLDVGDVVEVNLRGDPIGADYVWTWMTRIRRATHGVTATYRQSTFLSLPLSPEVLRKRAETFVPSLSVEGELVRDVLNSMRSEKSVIALARELGAGWPTLFRSLDEAHGFVASVTERYSL